MNFDNIYLEEEITELTETKRILNNINYQNIVTCKNYKEIFNQNEKILTRKRFWCAVSTHKGADEFCLKTHIIKKKKFPLYITEILLDQLKFFLDRILQSPELRSRGLL